VFAASELTAQALTLKADLQLMLFAFLSPLYVVRYPVYHVRVCWRATIKAGMHAPEFAAPGHVIPLYGFRLQLCSQVPEPRQCESISKETRNSTRDFINFKLL
jgi:hypothetical protein